jgi:hypothetical protein
VANDDNLILGSGLFGPEGSAAKAGQNVDCPEI